MDVTMQRALVLSCLISLAISDGAYDCDYNGTMYKKGDKFNDDCNLCFCVKRNQVICTEKSCQASPNPDLKEGDKYTCYCNGYIYNIGNTFTDGCYVCTCEGLNAFICKPFLCKPSKRNAVTDEHICSPNGKMYRRSAKGIQTCKMCICGRRVLNYCKQLKCFPSNATERVTLKVLFHFDEDSCYYKGKLYKKDDDIRVDCNICSCYGNDEVRCTQWSCGLTANNDNQVIATNCTYNGYTYTIGKTFAYGCHICFCSVSGQLECPVRSCPTHTWLLKIKDSCEYKGFFLSKGQEFMNDDCQPCKCLGNDAFICRIASCNSWGHFIANVPDHLAGSQNG